MRQGAGKARRAGHYVLLMRVLVMFVWWKEMTNLVAAPVPSGVANKPLDKAVKKRARAFIDGKLFA